MGDSPETPSDGTGMAPLASFLTLARLRGAPVSYGGNNCTGATSENPLHFGSNSAILQPSPDRKECRLTKREVFTFSSVWGKAVKMSPRLQPDTGEIEKLTQTMREASIAYDSTKQRLKDVESAHATDKMAIHRAVLEKDAAFETYRRAVLCLANFVMDGKLADADRLARASHSVE